MRFKARALAASFATGALMFASAAASAAPGEAPAQVRVTGRTAVIGLPYRTADKLIWVSATRMFDAMPFTFKGLEIKPHGGPNGMDLSVFTYVADKPGSTKLTFGLVPPGKMLIGPPTLIYKGPVARRITVEVSAK